MTDTGWSPWVLRAAVGIVVVVGSAGLLLATLATAPVRSTERMLRSARSLDDLSNRVRTLADPDVRAVVVAAMAVTRGSDARARSSALFFGALVHDSKARVAGLALLTERWPEAGSAEHAPVSQELSSLSVWLRRILDALRLDQLDAIGERQVAYPRALVEACVQDIAADAARPARFHVEGSAVLSVDRGEKARALDNSLANAARAVRSTVRVKVLPGLIRIGDDGEGLPRPFRCSSNRTVARPTLAGGVPRAVLGSALHREARTGAARPEDRVRTYRSDRYGAPGASGRQL